MRTVDTNSSRNYLSPVRFSHLVSLLRDMEKKGWIVDSFPFSYNKVDTITVITRYKEGEKKPSQYAKIKVSFVRRSNITEEIRAWANLYEVHFESISAFCEFWKIQDRNQGRPLFLDFSEHFAKFIPTLKVEVKTDRVERMILGGRAEGNDPLAIYCYDVRRNGRKPDGSNNVRSIENSNKAKTLRPELYAKYCADENLSFFFSSSSEDEKSDAEIMQQVAARRFF